MDNLESAWDIHLECNQFYRPLSISRNLLITVRFMALSFEEVSCLKFLVDLELVMWTEYPSDQHLRWLSPTGEIWGLWTLVTILLHEIKYNFGNGQYYVLFGHSNTELCHNMLYSSNYSHHTVERLLFTLWARIKWSDCRGVDLPLELWMIVVDVVASYLGPLPRKRHLV
jgi:hypothetical protein